MARSADETTRKGQYGMRGVVLAAGGGTRLRPLTDALPKTLLPVAGETTILDLVLANFAAVGLTEAAVVVGHAASHVQDRTPALERTYGVRLELIFNDKFDVWNNAYSLWLARHAFAESALVVNGDTVHPPVVEERLLAARGLAPIVLAVDDGKDLAEEEMKVVLNGDGRIAQINKAIDPTQAHSEYIGVSLVEAEAGDRLAAALRDTFERDPSLYYEDAFQQYADWGEPIGVTAIATREWIEVDNLDDLAAAREIACRY